MRGRSLKASNQKTKGQNKIRFGGTYSLPEKGSNSRVGETTTRVQKKMAARFSHFSTISQRLNVSQNKKESWQFNIKNGSNQAKYHIANGQLIQKDGLSVEVSIIACIETKKA